MQSTTVRSRLLDFGMGLGGLMAFVVAILLQSVSQIAMEYAVIVLPIVAFPLATWMRIRGGSSRWLAFFAVNIWLVAGDAALGRMAMANAAALLLPMAIALAASAAVVLSPSRGIAAIMVAAVLGALLVPRMWDAALSSSVNKPAPDVTLQLLNGRQVRLADLRGRVVVLNFWEMWCQPCVRELPELAAFAQQSPTTAVIAINSGIGGDKPGEIVRFLAARHVNLSTAFDADRNAYRTFGVVGVPTTVIIDPNGIVRERRVGFAATADFESWLVRTTARFARR